MSVNKRELFQLDDILIPFWKRYHSAYHLSFFDTLNNRNWKFKNIIAVPPEISENKQRVETQLTLVLNKQKNGVVMDDVRELFEIFNNFELPIYNGVQIWLNLPKNGIVFQEKNEKTNDDVYQINIEYCLTRLN